MKGLKQECGDRYHKVIDFRFSPDSRFLYTCHINGSQANYDDCEVLKDRWIMKWTVPLSGNLAWKYNIEEPSCVIPLQEMDVSPDGKTVAVGDCDGRIFLVDAETGKRIKLIQQYVKPWGQAFDARRIAVCSAGRTLR